MGPQPSRFLAFSEKSPQSVRRPIKTTILIRPTSLFFIAISRRVRGQKAKTAMHSHPSKLHNAVRILTVKTS